MYNNYFRGMNCILFSGIRLFCAIWWWLIKFVVIVTGGGRELDLEGMADGSAPGQYTLLQCRTVRIGSYKVVPKERVVLSSEGVRVCVPAIEDGEWFRVRSDIMKWTISNMNNIYTAFKNIIVGFYFQEMCCVSLPSMFYNFCFMSLYFIDLLIPCGTFCINKFRDSCLSKDGYARS